MVQPKKKNSNPQQSMEELLTKTKYSFCCY